MNAGSVNIENGQFDNFDFDDLTPDQYTDAVVASSAVPGVFPFSEFLGNKYSDPLICNWNVNLISAVNKCLEIVDDPSKIVLDMIVMYPNHISIDEKEHTTI